MTFSPRRCRQPTSCARRLRTICRRCARIRKPTTSGCSCGIATSCPDGARQAVAALARTYQSLIEQLFAQGIASGEFRAELNAQLTTLALLGLCNSVINARALPRASSIDDIIAEYARIVTDGVVSNRVRKKRVE